MRQGLRRRECVWSFDIVESDNLVKDSAAGRRPLFQEGFCHHTTTSTVSYRQYTPSVGHIFPFEKEKKNITHPLPHPSSSSLLFFFAKKKNEEDVAIIT